MKADDIGRYARFYLSLIASSLFNPVFLFQLVLQSAGQLVAAGRWMIGARGRRARSVSMGLPFGSRWRAHRGGITPRDSHGWQSLSQRYAYDFVKVDASGNSQRDDRHHVESYLAFGEPVLSPEDGVVVTARDGCRDHQRPGTGWIDWRARDIRGNFVVIRHEGGLFSFVGHLRCHSVRVRVGDHVRRGDVLGECGNSGHSTEPHIHFQVQDRESFYLGLGCPAALSGRVVGRSEGPPCGGAVYLSQGEDVEPFTGSVGAASNPVPVRVTVRDLGTSVLLFALNLLGVAFILYTEGALLFSGLRWLMNALE